MAGPDDSLAIDYASLEDTALVRLAQSGDCEALRHIMQRCNQRLFRIARGVLGDDAEAEDVVQQAYVNAFEKFATFRGESTLLTWMTRIAVNEAYGRLRLRQRRPTVGIEQLDASQADMGRIVAFPSIFGSEDPAAAAARAQVRKLIEHAIDALPGPFRIVFVMREIEECSRLAPWALSVGHALLAATGLVLLVFIVLQGAAPGRVTAALGLLGVAALGGFYLASIHRRGNVAPKAIVFIHAGVAITGFLTLLSAVLM